MNSGCCAAAHKPASSSCGISWAGAKSPPPGVLVPEVHVLWDEASCAQFVYLYSEIAQKFGGNITDFLELAGRPRRFAEPQAEPTGAPQPSIRIASIDVGGGTTDLMIATYYAEANRAIVPSQTFREGFRIAGEDVLREVIQQLVLPAIANICRPAASAVRARIPGRSLRRRIGPTWRSRTSISGASSFLRVLKPAGLALLSAYEAALPAALPGKPQTLPTRQRFFQRPHHRLRRQDRGDLGRQGFSSGPTSTSQSISIASAAPSKGTLGEVFENIAEAVHHFDCDIVLLSGRPSRLPATIDLFVNKLSVSPDRIITPCRTTRLAIGIPSVVSRGFASKIRRRPPSSAACYAPWPSRKLPISRFMHIASPCVRRQLYRRHRTRRKIA